MKSKQNAMERMRFLLPRFLREDYSPYECRVSPNRENYDLRARRIHAQNMIKTWINIGKNPFIKPVECRECLFNTRVPNIYIGRDGLCNVCMTYKRNFKPEFLSRELETFLNTPREEGTDLDAVVAFSGGKDSSACVYLAHKKFNLNVVAVLVNNGFIPEQVIENGRNWCRKWGVDLVVPSIDFVPHVKEMMDKDFKTGYPCFKCAQMVHKELLRYCARNRINRIIHGRSFWRWLEPEVCSARRMKDEESGFEVQLLALPFALQLTRDSVITMLENEGWSPVDVYGNSTNCPMPGLIEYTLYKRLGYHPELGLVSREIIAGYIGKEEGRKSLEHIRDLSPTLRRIVHEKLEEAKTAKEADHIIGLT